MGILDLLFGRNDKKEAQRDQEYAHESLREEAARDAEIAAAHHRRRVKQAQSKRRWTEDEY